VSDGVGRQRSKTISGASANFLYDGLNLAQELTGSTPTTNLLTGLGIDDTFSERTSRALPRCSSMGSGV
jgi:hypothetical protein